MKYAREVIDLMGAYPGREFRMAEILRHVGRGRVLQPRERNAARQAVLRVLDQLCDGGQVTKESPAEKSAYYVWGCRSLRHGHSPICNSRCDNTAGPVRA